MTTSTSDPVVAVGNRNGAGREWVSRQVVRFGLPDVGSSFEPSARGLIQLNLPHLGVGLETAV
jgi:hypothetical protein